MLGTCKSWSLLLLLPLFLAACVTDMSATPPPAPLSTVPVEISPSVADASSLLLLTIDGVRTTDLEAWMEEEHLPSLAILEERGRLVTLEPVEPTFTESALVSLLTGMAPAEHGYLGRGDTPVVEPFWAGMSCCRTVLIGDWPGAGPDTADWGIIPGEPVVDHAIHEPILAPASTWHEAPPSFSPRLQATLPLMHGDRQVDELYLLAVDSANDGVTDYNEYWISAERRIGPDAMRLSRGRAEWATLNLDWQTTLSWHLLDGQAESLKLYQSSARRTIVWPDRLERMLPGLGFYPPAPDLAAYEQKWVERDGLREMAQLQTMWLADVTARLWEESAGEQPRIVAARWPAPGHLQRAMLLAEPTQPGWDPERPNRLLKTRRRSMADTDVAVAQLISHVDLSRHSLFVTSPLGTVPIHSEINLPPLIRTAGLDPGQFLIHSEGESAWIRPLPSTPEEWIGELQTLLDEATDSNQAPLFQRIVPGEEVGGTAGRGWLFVRASPGYRINSEPAEQLVTPAVRLGDVGRPADSPELAGWWITAGSRWPDQTGLERMPLSQVAAAATQMLVPFPEEERSQE